MDALNNATGSHSGPLPEASSLIYVTDRTTAVLPAGPCPYCGGTAWWLQRTPEFTRWLCSRCYPPPEPAA